MYLISIVRPLYADTSVPEITIDNVLYALDSTTISTSIKLAAWAWGKYSKGAVKMHTLLALRGSIPANIHITDGRWHDSNELDLLTPEPLAFYMMDNLDMATRWLDTADTLYPELALSPGLRTRIESRKK